LVGALCFSVAEKSWTLIMRFSAGLENPGLKARLFGMNRLSAGLKSSSPLLKQGAPTTFGVDDIGGLFSGRSLLKPSSLLGLYGPTKVVP
jgi:hypothetical protein